MTEVVSLVADRTYTGFKSVSVTAAIDEAARTFELQMTEAPGEFAFPPGTPVELRARPESLTGLLGGNPAGSLLVNGSVNRYHTDGGARTHNVTAAGRGRGQDFVDSAADLPKGYLKDMTPGDLATSLDKFGVGISVRVPLRPVANQQIRQGETCETCVERYLRPQGAKMMGKADGSIEITNASVADRAAGSLTEGHNILRWSVDLSDDNRFSDYVVKGQNRHGTGDENLRIKETVKDPGVRRYRPKIIISETDTDRRRARERAQHQKDRNAGEGTKASVTVVGWRDAGGSIWEPNTLVYVNSPTLMHIVGGMLIERVRLSQDDSSGTITQLSLVDPRAHKGRVGSQGGGQSSGQTASQWGSGWT